MQHVSACVFVSVCELWDSNHKIVGGGPFTHKHTNTHTNSGTFTRLLNYFFYSFYNLYKELCSVSPFQ